MRELVISGVESVLEEPQRPSPDPSALQRLEEGYSLKNARLSREEVHAR